MIPKLGWRFVAPGINPNEAALQVLGLSMYCIERKDAPGQWTQELCFKTEFKANDLFMPAQSRWQRWALIALLKACSKKKFFGCAVDSRLMSAVTSPFIEQKASPRTC